MTHGPIERDARGPMNVLAGVIDELLNGPPTEALPGLPAGRRARRWGFVLLVAEFDRIEGGRVNYVSNGEREDMVAMLREYLARLEGRYVETPEARQ